MLFATAWCLGMRNAMSKRFVTYNCASPLCINTTLSDSIDAPLHRYPCHVSRPLSLHFPGTAA
jgi:hypothetical protein